MGVQEQSSKCLSCQSMGEGSHCGLGLPWLRLKLSKWCPQAPMCCVVLVPKEALRTLVCIIWPSGLSCKSDCLVIERNCFPRWGEAFDDETGGDMSVISPDTCSPVYLLVCLFTRRPVVAPSLLSEKLKVVFPMLEKYGLIFSLNPENIPPAYKSY